jgi:hypothetical protein
LPALRSYDAATMSSVARNIPPGGYELTRSVVTGVILEAPAQAPKVVNSTGVNAVTSVTIPITKGQWFFVALRCFDGAAASPYDEECRHCTELHGCGAG